MTPANLYIICKKDKDLSRISFLITTTIYSVWPVWHGVSYYRHMTTEGPDKIEEMWKMFVSKLRCKQGEVRKE